MKTLVFSSLALLIASAGVTYAGELQSGLAVGASVGPYQVKDITGPNKGKSLCYR